MARLGRYFIEDQALHVIQRGNDRQAVFYAAQDYARYRDWLVETSRAHDARIHAWVLMTNHVHLLVTPGTPRSLPRTMQALGRRYVGYVNHTYRRTGTLWEGRYRAAPIESEAHFLTCSRYIELNPVRARKVAEPADYPWSSYHANACGTADPLVTPHALYLALAANAPARREAYRDLFAETPDDEFVEALRATTNGGWALGSERFQRQIAAIAVRRASPLPKGRKAADLRAG